MLVAAQCAAEDAPVAESSAMALTSNVDHAAQVGSHVTNVAPDLGFLNDYLLDFQTTAQSLTSSLYGELDAIFSCINIHDISSSHFDKTLKPASRTASKSHHPAYIEPAYQWLLANIHNPYPSKEVRTKIARKAKSDIKSVEAWFVDARSRIGWNTLRKKYFGNKRAEIVDAATRFFVKFDEKRPLSTTFEFEFAQMEILAKNLYADRFVETTLVAKLDVAVKDLTPEMKAQAKKYALEEVKRQKAASSYPSPLHSPDRSPEPAEFTPLERDTDLALTALDALNGRKRRSLSPEGDSVTSDRPVKRARAESPAPTCLPSPTPSSHETLRRSSSPRPSSSNPMTLSINNRKRRLSETNGQSVSKRPRDTSSAPRLSIALDPLSMPSSSTSFDSEVPDLDNWFKTHFGSLSPANADSSDDAQGLDLDFYTYSTPEVDTPASKLDEPLAGISCYTSQCADAAVVTDNRFSDGLEISTNTFNYDELFDDYEQPFFNQQEFRCEIPRVLPASHSPLSQLSSLTNLSAVPTYDDVFSPANTTQPTDPNANIDWNQALFGQLADPFCGLNFLQDLNRNNDSQTQSAMPSVFFPEIVPPSTNLAALGRSDNAKVEIQMRLAAMKEEMRRLEKQIAEA